MQLTPIGHLRTPFPDKYGVPRQPGLVPAAIGTLRLSQNLAGAADGLEGVSHVWLIWGFHQVPDGAGRNKVRPPRLGGNTRIGVLATRSPFRPNPIGLSVCRLLAVHRDPGGATLELGGVDLVDGTPVFDVKPYVPYVDVVPDATVDWVPGAPVQLPVRWEAAAEAAVHDRPALRELIEQVLALDPRPPTHKARHRHDGEDVERDYAIRLEDVDIRWRVEVDEVVVMRVERVVA
jgi:tRNA-Thr(GGU) m(6)t(6)A37 methyltransferase TsaA